MFTRIFGDNLDKIALAEQRLFYVAMTRAIDELFVITRGAEKSPFLEKLTNLRYLDWDDPDLSPPAQKGLEIYLVKVANRKSGWPSPTSTIRNRLKESGYKWRKKEICWWKSFPATNFNVGALKLEKWSRKADGVDVQIFDEKENCLACYLINKGQWFCEFDKVDKSDLKQSFPPQKISNKRLNRS